MCSSGHTPCPGAAAAWELPPRPHPTLRPHAKGKTQPEHAEAAVLTHDQRATLCLPFNDLELPTEASSRDVTYSFCPAMCFTVGIQKRHLTRIHNELLQRKDKLPNSNVGKGF